MLQGRHIPWGSSKKVWGGASESAFLTNSQVTSMLLVNGLHSSLGLRFFGNSINKNERSRKQLPNDGR